MTVGFTGTRQDWTPAQAATMSSLMCRLIRNDGPLLRHGGCAGSDTRVHKMWQMLGGRVWLHPGCDSQGRDTTTPRSRVGIDGQEPLLPYLERNHVIVAWSRVLVATPAEDVEAVRSGTWATVRAARSRGVHVLLCLPSGELVDEASQAPRLL